MPRSIACGAIAALLVVASLSTPTDALKAHFRRADIPDGGFSKRGREAAAARKGKTETGDEKYLTEDDTAASSSSKRRRRSRGSSDPYDAYVRHRQGKSPGMLAFLVVACGGLWYLWTTGGGPAAVARVRAMLRGGGGGGGVGGGVGGGGAGLQRAGERLAKRAAAAEASMTGVFATAAGAVAARQQAGGGSAAQQPDSEQLRQARVRRYAKETREDIVGGTQRE